MWYLVTAIVLIVASVLLYKKYKTNVDADVQTVKNDVNVVKSDVNNVTQKVDNVVKTVKSAESDIKKEVN